ncbi:EP300-interacting inhibitor of differentiation 1 [Bos indicus]|uniref:EID1 protein n=5 Tax=Bovinae TaxID=27592 RepID=A4IFP9_BOVIN|nr:EP300-interacting inhibitor of differentiation 1 [Bos taurus]XP_010837828.1 PREDICTED: EP300-interacting inhibitor of differentiation 1 [Bison bison bison]XP_027409860.1 EP300-interacting inhibitor of differentiation 1 [Bos indicus x Bos taurus]AAI34698.1 EID1 protein [Bos taurus]AAI42398.1 EP300 interacting inhibitor of differentiation 1 [Bos taurus]DAA25200.1 TPA: EP300 interacting inhibitor of differentiation 1 [Bos taurus]
MSEMNELSELYEESTDLQMDVIPGESDLPHMEVGGGSRELSPNPSRAGAPPQLEEEGPMEEEAAQPMAEPQGPRGLASRPSPGEQPGQIAGPDFESEDEGEEFDDWEDDYDYPEEEPLSGAGYRVSAALEEANKMFLRTSRAREAALDGGFQMHYEKTPFDQLAFIEELFSLMVVNRLTEELGCDEIIDRE